MTSIAELTPSTDISTSSHSDAIQSGVEFRDPSFQMGGDPKLTNGHLYGEQSAVEDVFMPPNEAPIIPSESATFNVSENFVDKASVVETNHKINSIESDKILAKVSGNEDKSASTASNIANQSSVFKRLYRDTYGKEFEPETNDESYERLVATQEIIDTAPERLAEHENGQEEIAREARQSEARQYKENIANHAKKIKQIEDAKNSIRKEKILGYTSKERENGTLDQAVEDELETRGYDLSIIKGSSVDLEDIHAETSARRANQEKLNRTHSEAVIVANKAMLEGATSRVEKLAKPIVEEEAAVEVQEAQALKVDVGSRIKQTETTWLPIKLPTIGSDPSLIIPSVDKRELLEDDQIGNAMRAHIKDQIREINNKDIAEYLSNLEPVNDDLLPTRTTRWARVKNWASGKLKNSKDTILSPKNNEIRVAFREAPDIGNEFGALGALASSFLIYPDSYSDVANDRFLARDS